MLARRSAGMARATAAKAPTAYSHAGLLRADAVPRGEPGRAAAAPGPRRPGGPGLLRCAARAQRRVPEGQEMARRAGGAAARADRDDGRRLRGAHGRGARPERVRELRRAPGPDRSDPERRGACGRPAGPGGAMQDSCHLRNGLGVHQQPRALIAAVAEFVPVPGDDSCCGSAGTYSLLRPQDAARMLAPKLDAVEAAGRGLPGGGQSRAACARSGPGCGAGAQPGARRPPGRTARGRRGGPARRPEA